MKEVTEYIDKNIPIEIQFKYLRDKFSFQAVRTFKFFRKNKIYPVTVMTRSG